MGSHHHQLAILVPDDKLDCFGQLENFFCIVKKGLAFYSGPVLPPRTDDSLLLRVTVDKAKNLKIDRTHPALASCKLVQQKKKNIR